MPGKPIVFRCATATVLGPGGRVTVTNGGRAAVMVLSNFSYMVDVGKAECSVAADKERELKLVDVPEVNAAVRQCLVAGMAAVQADAWEVEAYLCGEPEALDELPAERSLAVLKAASAAGLAAVVKVLVGKVPIQKEN